MKIVVVCLLILNFHPLSWVQFRRKRIFQSHELEKLISGWFLFVVNFIIENNYYAVYINNFLLSKKYLNKKLRIYNLKKQTIEYGE